ncbi:MAG: Lrp/AsnC family transcriptional regulator [Thermoplasmata archaeon]|nr:MAG: Lrp/AsnC family transcriptional regulator [Thermoplasmata archaeon]
MAKSSKRKLQRDEQKILNVLETNANESIGNIAKRCGFSRQKVWRIIKQLEDNDTIWGYHACVDAEKINKKRFIFLFKLKRLPINNKLEENILNGKIDELAERYNIKIEDNIWIHGIYDGMISFYAQDLIQAKQFHELLIEVYNDNIVDSQLLEELIPIKKDGFINPRIEKSNSLLKI